MSSIAKPSYRQITVGGFPTGLTGLDEVLESLYREARVADDQLAAELVGRIGDSNYIPPAAEADFAVALVREYRVFCEQKSAGQSPKKREPWQGMPREQVPWFPALDETLCDGCIKCLEFCSHHVYAKREDGVVYVAEPYDCVVGCDECARLCKRRAITFPPRISLMLLAHQR